MPLSIFRRLGLGKARSTTVRVYVLIKVLKVDKFMFPADFIVLDIEEDKEIPNILGR